MISLFKYVLSLGLIVMPNFLLAQDTIFQNQKKKINDTVITDNVEVVKDSVVNITLTGEVIQDSIQTQAVQKIDRLSVPETVGYNKADLSSTLVPADFEKGLSDHPTLAQLDEHWKQELFNNNLFDSIYPVITKYKELEDQNSVALEQVKNFIMSNIEITNEELKTFVEDESFHSVLHSWCLNFQNLDKEILKL